MAAVFLSLHVLAAIVFVGPITVAVSLFPRYARIAGTDPDGHARAMPVVLLLHRISRVYAVLGLSVPVLGLAVATQLEVLTDAWLLTAMALTVLAAAVLALGVLPAQQRIVKALAGPAPDGPQPQAGDLVVAGAARLSMVSGVFALLWAIVVVLMVFRPGSTTGVGAG